MRPVRWLAAFFLLAIALPATAIATPIKSVLLIGDSITYGMVSGGGGSPYADVLAGLLGSGYDVINSGCGGATSLDWTLSQPSSLCGGVGILDDGLFDAMARPHLPADIATILLGTNDAVGFYEPQPIDVATYGLAMEEIIDNLFAQGVGRVVLMTAPDHDWSDPARNARLQGYEQEILSLCVATAAVCGPDLYALLDLELHFAAGDVHPNAAGHQAIAEALLPTMLHNPEPSTGLLVMGGLLGLGLRGRLGRRSDR